MVQDREGASTKGEMTHSEQSKVASKTTRCGQHKRAIRVSNVLHDVRDCRNSPMRRYAAESERNSAMGLRSLEPARLVDRDICWWE